MKFSIKSIAPGREKTGCTVVAVHEGGQLSADAAALDKLSDGYIARLARRDLSGKSGSTLLLHQVPGVTGERVLLFGVGSAGKLTDKGYREGLLAAAKVLRTTGSRNADVHLAGVAVAGRDAAWHVTQATLAFAETDYRFEQMKSRKGADAVSLAEVNLVVGRSDVRAAEKALVQARATAAGIALAKDLGNLPPNVCTPAYLAQQAQKLAKTYRLGIKVLERKDMEKHGMGALLAVAAGSAQPPKLIVLEYRGGKAKQAPVALVGKGITFDTGGISLKPAPEMDEMKFDMSGAGSVLGTLRAIAEMKLPINVVGLIPATENMPGGRATKPGDIVTTMSGQTVEILNTDAEGRLILCDALTYAERYNPSTVINIATLTGACVIALGHVASGLFANDDALAREVLAAGERSGDRAWQLPLWDDYQEQLRSNFADFANIGGRPAGSVTAACFLSRFTGKFRWAHLDVAGTAWRSGREKGSSGRPVPLLTQFLITRAGKE